MIQFNFRPVKTFEGSCSSYLLLLNKLKFRGFKNNNRLFVYEFEIWSELCMNSSLLHISHEDKARVTYGLGLKSFEGPFTQHA